MKIEYDPAKSRINQQKHGVELHAARVLLDDPERVCIQLAFPDEPRQMCIGCMAGKPWLAIVTPRGDSLRIISLFRFSRKTLRVLQNQRQTGQLTVTDESWARLEYLVINGC